VSPKSSEACELEIELHKLLDQYEDKRRTVEQRRRQVKSDDDTYQKAFAGLRSGVIRPVFEAAGAILAARGHEFRISEEEYAAEPAGNTREAAISIQNASMLESLLVRAAPRGGERNPAGPALNDHLLHDALGGCGIADVAGDGDDIRIATLPD